MHPTMKRLERELKQARESYKDYKAMVETMHKSGMEDEMLRPYQDELNYRKAELDRLIKAKEHAMGDNL